MNFWKRKTVGEANKVGKCLHFEVVESPEFEVLPMTEDHKLRMQGTIVRRCIKCNQVQDKTETVSLPETAYWQ